MASVEVFEVEGNAECSQAKFVWKNYNKIHRTWHNSPKKAKILQTIHVCSRFLKYMPKKVVDSPYFWNAFSDPPNPQA